MRSHRFDELARVLSIDDRPTTRRALLRAAGLGSAAIAAGAARSPRSAAQEATPSAAVPAGPPPQRRLPGGPTVEDTAFALEYDTERMFRFVADEVAYESYAGALRGAKGTLWGLAGNSVDQALLLAELLTTAAMPVRFAVGELDDAVATELLDSLRLDAAATRTEATRRRGAGPPPTLDKHPGLTPEQLAALQSPADLRQRLLAQARDQFDTGVRTIEDALAGAQLALPEATHELADRERRQHVWVQYADGPDWIDLDPSLPNAEAGTTSARLTETWDELPDDLYQRVLFRVVVETESGGAPVRQDALTHEVRATDLVGERVAFGHGEGQAFKGLGLAIQGLLSGTVQYVPYLLAGQSGEYGTAVSIGGGEGAMGALGTSEREGQAIAEWLEIDVLLPDAPPHRTIRQVFDRIGPDRRAARPIDLATLPPAELINVPDLGPVFPPLEAVSIIAVACQGTPTGYFQQDFAVEDKEADFALFGHAYFAMREALQVEIAADLGYRWYHNQPNLTAITLMPDWSADGVGTLATAVDLLHQGYGVVPIAGGTPATHPRVMAGVLAHVAERLVVETGATSTDGAPPTLVSVGDVFEEAARTGVAIRTLTPETADVAALDVSAVAKVRIAAALAAGYAVVVPARAILLGAERLVGWWQIDPATGTTFDLMESGMGAAAPMGEDLVIIVANVVVVRIPLYWLTVAIYVAIFSAAVGISFAIASQ